MQLNDSCIVCDAKTPDGSVMCKCCLTKRNISVGLRRPSYLGAILFLALIAMAALLMGCGTQTRTVNVWSLPTPNAWQGDVQEMDCPAIDRPELYCLEDGVSI